MKLKNIMLPFVAGTLFLVAACANAVCWTTINQYGRAIPHCTNGPGTGPNGPYPYWHGPGYPPGYGPYYRPGYGPGPYYRPGYGPYPYHPGYGPYPWHGHCWINANGGRVCN